MTVEDELDLLRAQVKQIPMLLETIEGLQKQVKELQDRLVKDSHNSSLPPSSDRFVRQRKTKSLRKKSGKRSEDNRAIQVKRWNCRRLPIR